MTKIKHKTRLVVVGLAAIASLLLTHDGVHAADHNEAPGAMMDNPADIADFYAWHTDSDTLVAVVTFAGLKAAGEPATYDLDVLYGIHIDHNDDNLADIDIWCRFGTNGAMDMTGVQCLNIPGADGPVEGPVETNIDGGNGVTLWAGLRDDPFFFDLEGFQATLMMGTLMFDSTRDSLAGLNVTAIVIEMPAGDAAGGGTTLQTWATTGRK